MAVKHGLGRGLGALIGGQPAAVPAEKPAASGGITTIPLDKIQASPWQPRHTFSPEALQELVASIKERGVLQPLLVRQKGDGFELIAGERRFRAAREAGLGAVPAIVMDAADHEALELALVENLQREDLNVVEEAEGYKALAEKFGMTQEQIATRVGKARASITNTMRLLGLAPEVKRLVAEGKLSAGHAKVLLGVEIPEEQRLLAQRAVSEGLSVRTLEKLVEKLRRTVTRKPRASQDAIPANHVAYLSDILHRHFGTHVRILPCGTLSNGKKTKGSIELDFYSSDDLDRVLNLMGLSDLQ
jgi:ParB family transcriptional regulator, chromosome partitioning protein